VGIPTWDEQKKALLWEKAHASTSFSDGTTPHSEVVCTPGWYILNLKK
jgi:hypothetical protein